MPYQAITNFSAGMDRRRKRVAGEAGSLWKLKNAHLTRGGEIERAKRFVQKYQLPDNTFGLYVLNGGVYVFGSIAAPAVPSGVTYQRLESPDSVYGMTKVLDVQPFDGKLYVIAQFSDGSTYHFYDGALVKDWYAGVVRASMTDNNGIAAHLADLIDDDGEYGVSASTNVITITGPANNVSFTVTTTTADGGGTNDQTAATATTQAAGVSQPQISTVTIGGTFQAGDKFTIRLVKSGVTKVFGYDGQPTPVSTMALTFKGKMHAAGGTVVHSSAIDNALAWNRDWSDNAGAGFINAGNQDEGAQALTALEVYQGQLAIFSRKNIQIWVVDADPDATVYVQTLRRTGTPARHSTQSYGNNDVFYLDGKSGIRSIKARDSSNAAFVADVGTAIDTFVQEWLRTLTDQEIADACSAIEPGDGRYWLALKNRIYVFSYFPGSKISAWSYYNPGFTIEHMSTDGDRLYVRSGNQIYLYGGDSGDEYPEDGELVAEVELPFLTAGKPATRKGWEGFDAAVTGDWSVALLPDPNDETVEINYGTINGATYHQPGGPVVVHSTHLAVKMTCSSAGPATISNMALHFEGEHDDR